LKGNPNFQWTLENWPFENMMDDVCQSIIQEGHWDICELPAYMKNGELIELGWYKLELAGAVVVMSF